MKTTNNTTANIYQMVTDRIIEQLNNGIKMIVWASTRAEKASKYILNLNPVTK